MKTKRIEMITTYAGPGGVIQPGKTGELQETEADGLIAGGYAKAVGASASPVIAPIEKQDAPKPEANDDEKMSYGKRDYKSQNAKGR